MYIMKQNGRVVVNADYADHYSIQVKPNAILVEAGLTNGHPVALGQYQDEKEAAQALGELYAALAGGQTGFCMPESLLFAAERQIKDARTRRKGGS